MPTPIKDGDWTWDDVQELSDGYRYEIVDGALEVDALPTPWHEYVALELSVLLRPKFFQPGDVLLTVEVLSPSSGRTDRVAKLREYAAAGIPSYWVVDPEVPSVTVLHGPGAGATAVDDEVLRVEVPFACEVVPSRLLP